mmetsp:Transcript_84394/g.235453  ORF Transcript_84394/g.235453 Transcript_84394/m.235453 type:complete len:207 (-) Transcript_84394:1991-2611(-)
MSSAGSSRPHCSRRRTRSRRAWASAPRWRGTPPRSQACQTRPEAGPRGHRLHGRCRSRRRPPAPPRVERSPPDPPHRVKIDRPNWALRSGTSVASSPQPVALNGSTTTRPASNHSPSTMAAVAQRRGAGSRSFPRTPGGRWRSGVGPLPGTDNPPHCPPAPRLWCEDAGTPVSARRATRRSVRGASCRKGTHRHCVSSNRNAPPSS